MAAAQGLACRESAAKSQNGVAELVADRPSEGMRDVAAGPAGYRRDPGQRGQRPGVGEPGPAVADLGQEPGSAQRARAREAGEDVRVGVGGQLASDLGLQGLDLSGQAGHGGGQRGRDGGLGGAVAAGRTRRC